MKSTAPVAAALLGMPLYFADCSSWARTIPPSAFIARIPREPSEPVPERMMPTAFCPLVLGKRPEKRINRHMLGMGFGARQKPELAVKDGHERIGRYDVYMVGFTVMPSSTSRTGMEVAFERSSAKMLSLAGARC